MPSLVIPASGLSLGSSHAAPGSNARCLDILNLTLSDEVIDDMIKCVRAKNGLQLSLGGDPKIIFGSQSIQLASSEEPFPCEYFQTNVAPQSAESTTLAKMAAKPARQPCSFWGSAKNRLAPTIGIERVGQDGKVTKSTTATTRKSPHIAITAGADAALSQLQSSLALADAQKKSNTTLHVKNSASLPLKAQQKGSANQIKPGRFMAQNSSSNAGAGHRSVPVSPYLNGVGSPALAPTSVPWSQQQAEKTKAIRRPIIHMLAAGPLDIMPLYDAKAPGTSEEDFRQALEKVADLDNGKWKLSQKSYKDLDVWSYKKYSTEQRQRAIESAIRAYDKMRLSATAPEWDRLLPEEERGTGKSLSKIQAGIATGTIQPAKGPRIRVQGAEDSGRDTAAEEEDDLFGDKIAVGGESMTRSHSNPPAAKSKKMSEKEAQARRLLGKPAKAKPAAPKVEKKVVVDANKVKSSKFVSDSDEGEDTYLMEPISKGTTKPVVAKTSQPAAAAPKPSTKRARDEPDHVAPRDNVRKTYKGTSTSPPKSSPLASSTPTNASDLDDSSSSAPTRPLKRKPSEYTDGPTAKRHQHSSSVSTSSSVTSPRGAGNATGANGVNGARSRDWENLKEAETSTRRFAAYYVQYKKMYEKVQASNPKNAEEYADLMDMHERLLTMKGQILRKNGLGV